LLVPPLPHPLGLGGKWTKVEICGLRERYFNQTTKEIAEVLLVLLLEYAKQAIRDTFYSHRLMTDSQPIPEQ